jgi:ferredoxin
VETPIATGRPDTEDLKTANGFGAEIMKKLGQIGEIQGLIVPGNHPYKERRSTPIPFSPEVDDDTCTLCGICAGVCPTSSITVSDLVVTEKPKCTACSACVQNCPTGAMHWKNEGVLSTAKWLSTKYCKRKEPEIFL